MRALVCDGSSARVVDRPTPEPDDEMAVVRVRLAGVCNTDLEIMNGYMAFRGVLGHELVGIVEAGPDDWTGQRVVCEINFACEQCATCLGGLPRHCPTRRVMGIIEADGSFAEYVSVPVANLHAVPDTVPDESAVFTEPLAAAFEILEQVPISPDTECVVLGDGKLGILVAQVLHNAGARVLAVGKHQTKLAHLERRGIATTTLAKWSREPADIVVEATGSRQGFHQAVEATRPRGTLVLKSTVAQRAQLDLAPLVIHELSVVGSRCGPFPPALRALETQRVSVEPLISARVPLREADEALRRAARPDSLKVLIEND